jgi:uncharacterized protein DUF6286
VTTAPERERAQHDAAEPFMPVAGSGPVAAPAAGYVGTVIALGMLAIGVIALRDSAVTAGWLDGREWTKGAIGFVDGLTFDWWMIPAGVGSILVGVWWVYAALRPRRRTAVAVAAKSSVWMAPAELARLASHAAESVPGVLEARSSASLRKITVTAHTTANGSATEVRSAVIDAVRAATAILSTPPKTRVRTRTGGT